MTDNEILKLILTKIEAMDAKFEARFDKLETRIDRIEARLDAVEARLDQLEADVRDIKLTLENEIRVNIQRVAEGHLDLSRNFQEAMKPSNEVEMLAIKVRMLETEVRELKCKIS